MHEAAILVAFEYGQKDRRAAIATLIACSCISRSVPRGVSGSCHVKPSDSQRAKNDISSSSQISDMSVDYSVITSLRHLTCLYCSVNSTIHRVCFVIVIGLCVYSQVREDDSGEPLKRGTRVTLHLKEDAYELADEKKLQELIKQYSEFIQFPIRYGFGWCTQSAVQL